MKRIYWLNMMQLDNWTKEWKIKQGEERPLTTFEEIIEKSIQKPLKMGKVIV